MEIQLSQVSRGTAALEFALCEISLKNKLAYLGVLANCFSLLVSPLAKVLNQYGHLSKAMYKLKAQKEEESETGLLNRGKARPEVSFSVWVGHGCVHGRDVIFVFFFQRQRKSSLVSTPSTVGNFYLSPCMYIYFPLICCAVWLVAQSSPTPCDPTDWSPLVPSVQGDSPSKNTGVGCHALLQGIFPTQGLNPCLPHCGWILYQLSHQGSPIKFTDQGKLEYQTQPKTDIYVNLYKINTDVWDQYKHGTFIM